MKSRPLGGRGLSEHGSSCGPDVLTNRLLALLLGPAAELHVLTFRLWTATTRRRLSELHVDRLRKDRAVTRRWGAP